MKYLFFLLFMCFVVFFLFFFVCSFVGLFYVCHHTNINNGFCFTCSVFYSLRASVLLFAGFLVLISMIFKIVYNFFIGFCCGIFLCKCWNFFSNFFHGVGVFVVAMENNIVHILF